jgi:hypothetical protein
VKDNYEEGRMFCKVKAWRSSYTAVGFEVNKKAKLTL